jgi:hypothetical protein
MAPTAADLPVPLEDLPALLSRELVPARPSGVYVTHVEAQGGPDLLLILKVIAGGGSHAGPQEWRLELQVPAEDLILLDPYSFVLTLRANLEEWWQTGRGEMPGLQAVRLT